MEISSASLYLQNQIIVKLNLPKLRIEGGIIYIDCYIDKNFFGKDMENFLTNKKSYFNDKIFTIKAIECNSSKLIFNQVVLQSESYPSYKFTFLCYDYYTEYINTDDEQLIFRSKLKYLIVEGIDMHFTKTTQKQRLRTMFGKDDSKIISIELDNSQIYFNYQSKKRVFNLNIGLIKNLEDNKSVLIKFFQEELIPFQIYQKIKHSLKFFISYLSGNNVVIREEYFQYEHKDFTRNYSQQELTEFNVNCFLPIHNVHFKHEEIINYYTKTLSNYLIWDKKLNLSEIIYLINQSKQVNIESSFFILIIVIEKLANSIYNAGFVAKKINSIIEDEKFNLLKEDIFKLIESTLSGISSKEKIGQLKSKVGNINNQNKTENKIDILLEFCEIKRTEEINRLFPQLRNLAIHQGEISYEKRDSSKNYQVLFILINNIICNLIQYKGVRFIEHKDETNYIAKKEEYLLDLEKL